MQIKKRARSKTAKLERHDAILLATETLLRQSGFEMMTMQAVAEAAGLGKGTLYLYFSGRDALVLGVYGRLFDGWIDCFASHRPLVTGLEEFCQYFWHYYANDILFLRLGGVATALGEMDLDRKTHIMSRRAMANRVKRLAGIVCRQLGMTPITAQKLVWGLLTIASGTAQMAVPSLVDIKDLPDDVTAFLGSTNFETVFLNAALPFCVGMMQR